MSDEWRVPYVVGWIVYYIETRVVCICYKALVYIFFSHTLCADTETLLYKIHFVDNGWMDEKKIKQYNLPYKQNKKKT